MRQDSGVTLQRFPTSNVISQPTKLSKTLACGKSPVGGTVATVHHVPPKAGLPGRKRGEIGFLFLLVCVWRGELGDVGRRGLRTLGLEQQLSRVAWQQGAGSWLGKWL